MILRSRSASRARAVAVAAAAAALIPAIAGCEAGANAPTQQWHQPTPGASATVDKSIRLNNVFVLGPAPAGTLRPGQSAGLFLAVSNDGAADRLLSITAPGTAHAVQLPGGGINVGAQQSVLLAGPQPKVILEGLTRPLAGGQMVRMVLDFQRAGSVTMDIPVMPRASDYATFSPAPSPAATGKAGRSTSPTPTPSTSGTASPSPSPSATG